MEVRPEIIIGGRLPGRLLEEFLDEIDSCVAVAVFRTAEQLRQALDESGHLVLMADNLDGLADYCVAHEIAFDARRAEGCACYRAGMASPMLFDDGALFDATNIRPLAKELARLLTLTLTREKVMAAATKVIRRLHGFLPPELPPLEIEE